MFNVKRLSREEQKQFYGMLDKIQDNEERIKELETQNEDLKATVERYLDEDGYKDDGVTISWRKPSESKTIDTKRIQTDDRELYNKLFVKYGKITKRVGGFSYKFKGGEE